MFKNNLRGSKVVEGTEKDCLWIDQRNTGHRHLGAESGHGVDRFAMRGKQTTAGGVIRGWEERFLLVMS